jgi:glycine dehydrogenase subunit 1
MEYIPVTENDRQNMLKQIGVSDVADLFSVIPEAARIKALNLPEGMSEHKLIRTMEAMSRRNAPLTEYLSFCGAGIYEHFIPSLVGEIVNRSEFATAYTPYQPEASQGTLQAVFEYQSLMTALTGLDVSNASLYDGASAVAEAALLGMRATGKNRIVVSAAVHPEYRQVLATYLQGTAAEIVTVPLENGITSSAGLHDALTDTTAALIVQSPNFLGCIEELSEMKSLVAACGALFVTVVNPISLGILRTPGECGADIAVGEGQVLGNASACGGFTFGFMTARKALSWKMPGRIVGQTTDTRGRRGYVLTLQSREQHIRREKATSNICTNAALNALAGCVYLAGWGKEGLRKLAEANLHKSHYAFDRLIKVPGFQPAFPGQPFFNEFVLRTTKDIAQIKKKLMNEKIIGPLALRRFMPDYFDCLLFCVTETKSKEDIDKLVNALCD